MPNATNALKLYRTIHKSRAQDMGDATEQAIAYFATRGYSDVVIIESGINGLGHYEFVLSAGDQPERETATVTYTPEVTRSLTETLTCQKCGVEFTRPLTRGRKPRFCPEHAGTVNPPTETAPTETGEVEIESFTCTKCWNVFTRPVVRGRKPTVCPTCKGGN